MGVKGRTRLSLVLSVISLVGLVLSSAWALGISFSSGAQCMYGCNNMTYDTSTQGGGLTFPVVFDESGLAPGTTWSVTINGQTVSSNNASVILYESSGTYAYQVSSVLGYNSKFSSGEVTVGNGPASYVVQRIDLSPNRPTGAAFDPKNGYIYIADSTSGNVSIINGSDVISNIHLGHEMTVQYSFTPTLAMLAYDPSNGFVYVTAFNSTEVFVINDTNLLGTVSVGTTTPSSNFSFVLSTSTYGIAYDSANGYMYVTRTFGKMITMISGLKVVGNIPISISPYEIAANSVDGLMYVTSYDSGSVLIINGSNIQGNVSVSSTPYAGLWGIAYDSLNNLMYVSNHDQQNVAFLNSTNLIGVINTTSDPLNIVFDPSNTLLYITTDYPQGSVLVSNGTQVLFTLQDSPGTFGLAYDSNIQRMYSTNEATGNVSVIASGGTVTRLLFSPAGNSTSSSSAKAGGSATLPTTDYAIAAVVVVAVVSAAITATFLTKRKN